MDLRSRLRFDEFPSVIEFAENLGCISELPQRDFTRTQTVEKLVRIREAADFESLRVKAMEYKDKYGYSPKVFLMKFGSVTDYRLRSDFALDFFKVGGFEVIEAPGSESVDDLINGFLESNAQVGVICSSDILYPTFASILATSIKKANSSSIVVLTGLPSEQAFIEELKASGVDFFIYSRSNVIVTLTEIYNLIFSVK
jgi:methylmalonyl-CoA mutase